MRRAVVAGQFYPGTRQELSRMVESCISKASASQGIVAAVAPHAGYMYSGKVAGFTYGAIAKMQPRRIAIIGPDHTGASRGRNLCFPDSEWETPLGAVKTFEMDGVPASEGAHLHEHSIEVQLPFLQTIYSHEFEVCPIIMGDQGPAAALSLAERIDADLVLASSDFSHYVPRKKAIEDDLYAIEAVENMDADGLYRRVAERKISACGYGAIAAALLYAKRKGANSGKLLKYGTSGGVTGDSESVVGYASIIFK